MSHLTWAPITAYTRTGVGRNTCSWERNRCFREKYTSLWEKGVCFGKMTVLARETTVSVSETLVSVRETPFPKRAHPICREVEILILMGFRISLLATSGYSSLIERHSVRLVTYNCPKYIRFLYADSVECIDPILTHLWHMNIHLHNSKQNMTMVFLTDLLAILSAKNVDRVTSGRNVCALHNVLSCLIWLCRLKSCLIVSSLVTGSQGVTSN